MNRGSDLIEACSSAPYIASMRPRFMNRGSEVEVADGSDNRAASMRPRFMNRGSISGTMLPTGVSSPCFNEAPIHESGK